MPPPLALLETALSASAPSIAYAARLVRESLQRSVRHIAAFAGNENGGDPSSHTSAHESIITVAPFRAWRGSLPIVARGPQGPPQIGGEGGIRTLDTFPYTHFPGVRLRPLGHLSGLGAELTTTLPCRTKNLSLKGCADTNTEVVILRGLRPVQVEPYRLAVLGPYCPV